MKTKMKTNKKQMGIITLVIMMLATSVVLAGCGANAKEDALNSIKAIKTSDYMTEDQDSVKEIKDVYTKKIENLKSDDKVKKAEKDFKTELASIPTKKVQIKTFKDEFTKNIEKMSKSDKKKAESVLKKYEDKINKANSKKELTDISAAMTKDISKETGKTVAVNVNAVSAKAQTSSLKTNGVTKAAVKKASTTNNTSTKKTVVTTKPSKPSTGSSTTATKKKVWVVDRAAWTETKYRTETDTITVYRCSHGIEFSSYSAAYAHYSAGLDSGDICGFGPVDKTISRQVPYTVSHPATGHYEYR